MVKCGVVVFFFFPTNLRFILTQVWVLSGLVFILMFPLGSAGIVWKENGEF